jgi:hypothetical protein
MPDSHFEELCRRLQRQGYHVHLQRMAVNWRCDLACGVGVLEGTKPRPRGIGATATEAVENAAAEIKPSKPNKGKSANLAAGLPRGDR